MSSGLRSSVQKAMNGELRSVIDGRERVQVLADRALANQHRHALRELLVGLGQVRHLVVGADAGAEIAVEGEAAEQRAVTVDRPGLEGGELGEACRDRASAGREVHELGEARAPSDGRRGRGGRRPRGARRRSRGRSPARSSKAARAGPSRSPSRRRGNSGGPPAPSTLAISCGSQIAVVTPWASTQRSNSSGVISDDFDVAMRVDEAGDDDLAADVDLADAAVLAERSDDPVVADRDVASRSARRRRDRRSGRP